MLYAGKQQRGVKLGRWLLRGPSRADGHHARVSTNAAGVKAERNRRYYNKAGFVCGKQDHKQRDCPQSRPGKVGKGVSDQSHGQTPIQQQQFTSGPARYTRSKATWMARSSTTLRASAYNTAPNGVATETEPAAPEPSRRE